MSKHTEKDPEPATLPKPKRAGVFVTRDMLVQAGACSLRAFEQRVGKADGFEWTPAEVQRTYKLGSNVLRFYEFNELVPMLEADGVPSVAKRQAEIDAIRARKPREPRLPRFLGR
jgi:hypothetical protein